ncbi:MerR family transcriptional regulator [Bacillus horti]|uniref:DNA-binding transcriptional MerR regulator n=1 Tax=Caldalkalibacillus horti TaxID=77523 RepID=A0ABT9VX67_9BACI|nr:MerR family transcriptional regulator [Bacillus horti]MDQ0165583.1 DNA-binding transcriptional MerR regulator [Bacillus horti]
MKISQLAEKTGVSARSIRHYEKKNLLTAKRLENGYRLFQESDVERVKTIQIYLGLGLNTDQIEEMISCTDYCPELEMDELCSEMLEVYEKKLKEINQQMDTLAHVKRRLEEEIAKFKEVQEKLG